jgi:putative ABC transport system permease protein
VEEINLGSPITITLRKLYREKLYALINVAGLSLGIACCLILALYLRSELTYDQYHVNHKKIFRVVNEFNGAWPDVERGISGSA